MAVAYGPLNSYLGTREELFSHLREIWRKVGWTDRVRSNAEWEHCLKCSLWVYLAWDETRVVGFVRLVDSGLFGHIHDVAVDPDYWRQGIGTKLMDELDKTIAEGWLFPWNEITLEPWDGNPWNREFYEKLGYVDTPCMRLTKYVFPEAP